MKKSFMTFMCTKWAMPTIAAKAAAFGYEGVELRVDAGHAHGFDAEASPETIRETRRLFADAGVAISAIATSCRFAMSDPAERQGHVDHLLKYFDVAEVLGVPVIRVFGGMFSAGSDHAGGKCHVVDALRSVARAVAGRPVVAALETHDDYRPGVEVADVLRQVGSPNVQANYDIMHPAFAGEALEVTLAALKGHVVHSHIHDGCMAGQQLQFRELGQGTVPLFEAMKRLTADGYTGHFSLEYMGEGWDEPDTVLPRCMQILRTVERG
jgi:sugar phosphate isomerase/epimerase